MKTFSILILAMMLAQSAFAEGLWQSNGYVFSNVNVTQRGQEVTVAGRVSSGSAQNPLHIKVEIESDNGERRIATARVSNYTGRGELFKAKASHSKRALWWSVKNISTDSSSNFFQHSISTQNESYSYYTKKIDPEYPRNEPSDYKYYQSEKNVDKDKISVTFRSQESIQVIIRDKKKNESVLIKNISPYESRPVLVKPGEYNAKIIGKEVIRHQDFIVSNEGQEIELQ